MENLGKNGLDLISGFKGVITSKIKYLTGCDQYGITSKVNAKGEGGDTEYFDVRSVKVSGRRINIQDAPEDPGGPNRHAPRR